MDQFGDGLFATVAVSEGPPVDVHGDKFIGSIGFHVAGELHGVIKGFFAVFEAVFHAIANSARNLAPELRPKRSTNGIAPERQGEIGLLMPPHAEIDDAMQAELRKKKLAFVNKQAG